MTETQARAPFILSLDTTTDVRSVALVAHGRVRAHRAGSLRGAQSANLLGDINAVLAEARAQLKEIDLFAVATGPGSFTGLRAGLATIKAFATTLGKPVVGVPTLHAVARAAGFAAHVVATLPAGRGELFAQLVAVTSDGAVEELSVPAHLPPAVIVERALNWPVPLVWAGAGAHAQATLIAEAAARAGIEWRVAPDQVESEDQLVLNKEAREWILARPAGAYAAEIAALAGREYEAGRAGSAVDLQALYVRLSDAELNERCRV